MAHLFKVRILTREKRLYDGDAESVIAPGEAGYLAVLANHAPLVTTLRPGVIAVRDALGKKTLIDSRQSGVMEVRDNSAVILLS